MSSSTYRHDSKLTRLSHRVSILLLSLSLYKVKLITIGPLQDLVTWYRKNYAWTQATQWDFQNNGMSGWSGMSSFDLEVPQCNLCPSIIYSIPGNQILQMAYCLIVRRLKNSYL